MHPKPLLAPYAKVERAKVQINDLNTALKDFFQVAHYEVVSKLNKEADEEVWSFKLKTYLPSHISVRVGEIFHNLRSALDQMLGEVVTTADGGGGQGIEFPFGLDAEKFYAALGKQKKRLPADAVSMIEALQPYKGGNELLWLLHSTNRNDKHRAGLVPINVATKGQNSFISTWGGQALVLGSREGQHLICERWVTPEKLAELEGRPTGLFGNCLLDRITGLPLGPTSAVLTFANPGPGSAEGTYDFLTTTPGTKFKTDFQPVFDVAFRDGRGFEREPIVSVLTKLRDLVESTLLAFERRFFN